MKLKHILVLGLSVLLVVALLASWLFRPADISQLGMDTRPPIHMGQAQCDSAQGPCEARAGPLLARLNLLPPVTSLQPFEMHLQLEGVSARQAVITFTMADMEMGLNRFVLRPAQDGDWHGQAVLPVCSEGRKDWLATLTVVTDEGDYRLVFPFTAR